MYLIHFYIFYEMEGTKIYVTYSDSVHKRAYISKYIVYVNLGY